MSIDKYLDMNKAVLRKKISMRETFDYSEMRYALEQLDQQAATIAALEAENARLREALEEIHRLSNEPAPPFGDTQLLDSVVDIAWEALGRPESAE